MASSNQHGSRLVFTAACFVATTVAANPWPDFRGPAGDGHCRDSMLPLHWSESEAVTWKTEIPGSGWSSPVIWDDQIWLTTAEQNGRQLFAIAVHRDTGKILQRVKIFDVQQPQTIDPLNTYASPSPVIDADHVYVHFGTYGTACVRTRDAGVIWARRDLPVDHQKGPGSSPVLYQDLLILQCDGNDVQYIIALNKRSGQTVWKTPRSADLSARDPDYRKSFSTPLVAEMDGRVQIVSTAAGAAYGYEPRSGRELWRLRYSGHTNVSRPVAGDGFFLINTGYPSAQLWAVRFAGNEPTANPQVAWKRTQGVPLKPSILLHDGLIYMVSDSGGVLTCCDLLTGETVWKERLAGNYSASPIVAGARIYFFSQEGVTTVIRAGREYQQLSRNKLADGVMASPAISNQSLYLRTTRFLYRIDPVE